MLVDLSWPAVWPVLLAAVSTVPGALQAKVPRRVPPKVLNAAPHALCVLWLLCGVLTLDASARIISAVFLVSIPGVPWQATLVYFGLWMAGLVVCKADLLTCMAIPALLFVLRFLSVRLERGKEAATKGDSQKDECEVGIRALKKRFPNYTAPTKKEFRSWAKAFALQEELLVVYACTVPTRIAHQGSLFLSVGHVCFRGVGVVARGLEFAVPLEDVKEIQRGNTRENAVLILKKPRKFKGRHHSVTSIELRGCEAGASAIAHLLAHGNHDQEDDSDSESVDSTNTDGPSKALFADKEPFQSLLKVSIPGLKLTPLAEDLLGEWGGGALVPEFFGMLGGTEIRVGPWVEGEADQGKIREMFLVMPVPPAPMCPRSTKVTKTYSVAVSKANGDSAIELLSSAVSHDVPFGDNFLVQEKLILQPGGAAANVELFGRCIFIKSCGLLQGKIRSGALSNLTSAGEKMMAMLKDRSPQAPASAPAGAPPVPAGGHRKSTCGVNIWELQRRTTLMSNHWRAPFLPHDGSKRWRWVGTDYKRHSWTTAPTSAASAASSQPPVQPQCGWAPLDVWQAVKDKGDTEGWQYAIDFYHDDKHWGDSKHGCSVRRRLWSRRFVET